MKKVVPLLVVSAVLIAAATFFAPKEWKWPAIGAVGFVAIFVSTRVAARVIGEEAEKRFNRK